MGTSQDGAPSALIAPLLLRLRRVTEPQHAALERAFDLVRDDLQLETYRQWLERLYGYYCPVEVCLLELGGWKERGLDLEARCKVPLLLADLRALGREAPDELPLCTAKPDLRDVSQGFGCLYVLEGATLGGRLISRHLRRTLGIGPDSGGRFFNSYGERVPMMWQAFGTTLCTWAMAPAVQHIVVQSAIETFETLHRWLVKGS